MLFDIRSIEETASTNDDARRAAESGAPEGTVIWAQSQTSGRGRQGRIWHSPQGNLYFSVVLRPKIPERNWAHFSFVACLAIHQAVGSLLPKSRIELKWPNDVLVGKKKISGILLEGGQDFLVAGMGLNVAHIPEEPLYTATSLMLEKTAANIIGVIPAKAGIHLSSSIDTDLNLESILNQILTSFGSWCERLQSEGFPPVREAWLSHALKGPMRVHLPADTGELHGEFAGLDDNGNLLLRLADGSTRKITAGDIL